MDKKKLIIPFSLAITCALYIYSLYFSYSPHASLLNIADEFKGSFGLSLSLVAIILSIVIYEVLIQEFESNTINFKPKFLFFKNFRSYNNFKLFYAFPIIFTLFSGSLVDLIYFIIKKPIFCIWGPCSYSFISNTFFIFYFVSIFCLIYGYIRLFLQQCFFGFFNKMYTSLSNFIKSYGKYLIILVWGVNLIFLSLIIIDSSSHGSIFHFSKDSSFSYYWGDKALKDDNLALCEIISISSNRSQTSEYCRYKNITHPVFGDRNICIDNYISHSSSNPNKLFDKCNLLKDNASIAFCLDSVIYYKQTCIEQYSQDLPAQQADQIPPNPQVYNGPPTPQTLPTLS